MNNTHKPQIEPMRFRIIATARSLFQQQGFDKTTVDDISRRLQLSENVIAAHFSSLDDLLEAVWSES